MKKILPAFSLFFSAIGAFWYTLITIKSTYNSCSYAAGSVIPGTDDISYHLETVFSWENVVKYLPNYVMSLLYISLTVFLLLYLIKSRKKMLVFSVIIIVTAVGFDFVYNYFNTDYFRNLALAVFTTIRFSFLNFLLKSYVDIGHYYKYFPFALSVILSAAELVRVSISKRKIKAEL
ncbi:MAG: hypothetical protein PHD46_02585 [Eubacteriales bacterium]|nr:hypothetical protein [Eubacteriales bacterium]